MTKGTQTSLQPVPVGPTGQGLSSFHPAGLAGRAFLAEQIRAECAAFEADLESGAQRGVRIGDLLIEAKADCRHGEWQPWLAANFPYSYETARRFMRAADKAKDNPGCFLGDTVKGFLGIGKPEQVDAESEATEDEDEATDGEIVDTNGQEKGGECEEQDNQVEEPEDDDEYPRPAEPGEVGFVVDQMRLLVMELELYSGMETMAGTMKDWIQRLEKELDNNE